jgi:polyphosphate glucokinase
MTARTGGRASDPSRRSRRKRRTKAPITLSIDVGASHVKGHLLDERGAAVIERLRVDTPSSLTPAGLVGLLVKLATETPEFDRVSVGVPGIVHRGIVYSLPVAGDHRFRGFPLARELERRLGRPVRLANDGEMHGLGVIRRKGVELVLTLGTGLGTALYLDGALGPRIQFVSPPDKRAPVGGPYGDAARKRLGKKKWNRRVEKLIEEMRRITNFTHCYVGGGNAERLAVELPRDVTLIDNAAAALGGLRLWEWDVEC